MKALAITSLCLALCSCTTLETFDAKGNRTSRQRSPSPEFWTSLSNGVSTFGAKALAEWTKQIADQQRWERGEK